MNRKHILLVGAGIILLGIGFLGGYFLTRNKYLSYINGISLIRENDAQYPLVHPIITLKTPDALDINELTTLDSKVKKVITQYPEIVSRYSVYFRDFTSGLWIGINENDQYDPASMLKVALAIAAYRQAELDPGFLQESQVYTPQLAAIIKDVPYSTPSELTVNQSYTISDLIEKMIVDSDNGAKDVLGNTVDKTIMNDVYSDLNIPVPSDSQEYYISAKQYTVFLTRLFNATYLNENDSNQLLGLLSKATFNDGLVAGVPNGVQVANKYGEHVNSTDNTINAIELSDCGIIYSSKTPYALCVMTEGKDESDLAGVIAAVSKTVYQEVDSDYK